MNYRTISIIIFTLFFSSRSNSQVILHLKNNSCSAQSEYFDSILVFDNRDSIDKGLGKVKVDYRKGHEVLLPERSLSADISQFYSSLKNKKESTAGGKLAIVVYRFWAEENIPGIDDETAGFAYSADYFKATTDSTFQLLGSVDTTVFVQSFDVTKYLLQSVNDVLCHSVYKMQKNRSSSDHQFTTNDLSKLKSTHTKHFKAYTDTIPQNGVYETWNDFLNNRKMEQMVTEPSATDYTIYKIKENGKKQFRTPIHKVAICNGVTYYVNGIQPVVMSHVGNDYSILTKIRVNNGRHNESDLGLSLFATTAIAFLMPLSVTFYFYAFPNQQYSNKLFDCRINPRTGSIIPIRYVSDKELIERGKANRAASKKLRDAEKVK
ncbi:MAG: hypothetical protein WC716_07225 [Chitinophagaceae bacterium]|jgi:uncharacterized protein YbcV (DUF1398 family)